MDFIAWYAASKNRFATGVDRRSEKRLVKIRRPHRVLVTRSASARFGREVATERIVEAARDFRMQRQVVPIFDKIDHMLGSCRGACHTKISFGCLVEFLYCREH